jgi:nucleotide-binding universal stress UspA family protein
MNEFKRILVATDTRLEQHPIVDEAAEIAIHCGASLKIVDVAPEFSWTVRLTMSDHEHVQELICKEKADALEALAEPLRLRGIDVETKVLKGKTSVEIIREVLRSDHDLVLRIAKGKDSRSHGFFGNTGARLLRQCPCAVWLVSSNTSPKFTHVLACVDTSSGNETDADLNHRVYELAEEISHYHGGRFSVLHAWAIWNEQMLKGRMGEELFSEIERDNEVQVSKMLNAFLERYNTSKDAENIYMVKGEPADVISELTMNDGVDLVVMGTVARSGMAGMVTGNSAEQILSRIRCSVLALKPDNFVSPVQLNSH